MRKIVIVLGVVIAIGAVVLLTSRKTSPLPSATIPTNTTTTTPVAASDIAVVTTNLQVPWEIVFLPQGEMLITERPGNLLRIGTDKKVYPIDGVRHIGEGGLLGLALHPQFEKNHYLYLYLTSQSQGKISNRVERYSFENDNLSEKTVILDNIPAGTNHDGGRMAFGPEGYLYITTGETGQPDLAQDKQSLAGKILRISDDGSVPADNPFGNAVYSYGHRNPQGLAWDNQGRLWSTEHGRSGVQSGLDELNLITKGANYGWPTIEGDEQQADMTKPVANSGSKLTWAPASAIYWEGSIWFTGLRGQALYQYQLTDGKLTTHLQSQFGRLRALSLGPDGWFYLGTSNRDGRGSPENTDDRIIKVNPRALLKP